MLHGVRFLRSAAAALARLAHAILGSAGGWALLLRFMPLCPGPTSVATTTATAVPAPCWHQQNHPGRAAPSSKKQVHPAALAVDEIKPAGCGKDQQLTTPAALVLPALNTAQARGRPPRLAIPPPVACAPGVDPFGAAADREPDVATELEVQGEGFCLASRRGVRHPMEDGYGVIAHHITQGGSQLAFYGVYDGHGGRAAVDFVADKLGKNVVAALAAASTAAGRQAESGLPSPPPTGEEEDESETEQVVAAIRAAYLTTDSEFLSQGVRGGACAATALVKDGDLYVANVGDCRAVLGSRGGVATALTSDHTAAREDERRRIESSGGYVSCGSSGVWRVQDCLAVSRAFGDASMKPWVTCEPEVSRRRLTPDCQFLVVASDGLWNKVSCQEAVSAAAAAPSSSAAVGPCKELVTLARTRGSRDDITVMVVDLQRFLQL